FYFVSITDSMGCNTILNAPLQAVNGPTITIDSFDNVTCFGGTDGSISVSITGNNPFTIIWLPDSQITEDLTNIGAGLYTIQVYDSVGCPGFATQTILEPIDIQLNLNSLGQVLCNGDTNGVAVATPLFAVKPYQYNWNKGNPLVVPPFTIDSVRINLPPGYTTLNFTDARGCNKIDSIFIANPPVLTIDTLLHLAENNCFNDSVASVKIRPKGGTQPYYYFWINQTTGDTLPINDSVATGLWAGLYTVVLTDTAQCGPIIQNFTISQPSPLNAQISGFAHVSCFDSTNGFVSVAVTGGTKPYQYNWSAGNGGIS